MILLLSLVITCLYLYWKGRWWELAGMVSASVLLLATNYLSYAALYAVLACDWLLFRRRALRLSLGQWLLLLGPQIVIGILAVWIYNPLGAGVAPSPPGRNLLLDKLTLLWWNFRDLNACEFCGRP